MIDLASNSKVLADQANEILKELDLLNFLNRFGKPYLVGSVFLNLMTWRDIDIEVICVDIPTKQMAIDVVNQIFKNKKVRNITITDYRLIEKANKPKGLYASGEYIDDHKNSWKLDIWLLTPNSANSKDKSIQYAKRITPEQREVILEIKSQLHDHPMYRRQFFSVDIYDAVLDKKVKSVENFKSYLSQKGLNI